MQQPPLLPEETLARVTRVAKLDGTSVVILGSIFAILAAGRGDVPFALIGVFAAGAGAMELHGADLLRHGSVSGMRWLLLSQPFLYLVVIAYCIVRVRYFELPPIPERFREVFELSAQQLNLSVEEYLRVINRLTVQILAVVSSVYQGLMTVYYMRRRRPIEIALRDDRFA